MSVGVAKGVIHQEQSAKSDSEKGAVKCSKGRERSPVVCLNRRMDIHIHSDSSTAGTDVGDLVLLDEDARLGRNPTLT